MYICDPFFSRFHVILFMFMSIHLINSFILVADIIYCRSVTIYYCIHKLKNNELLSIERPSISAHERCVVGDDDDEDDNNFNDDA